MANDSKDLQTQLDLQQAINKAIQERAGLLRSSNEALSDQVRMQRELCAAMECKELDDAQERVQNLNGALAENRQNIDDSTDATAQMNKELKKSDKLGAKAKGALVGAFVGIKNAIGTAFKAFGSLVSGIVGLPGRVMRIGGAILGAWGSMTEGLMDMAQAGGGGGKPILDSLEKVRASFGDLAGPTSTAVVKSWKNLKQAGGKLAAGGASMAKIFGRGRAGAAAALDFMRESAEALGPIFHTMSKQIEDAGHSLVLARKGLGLTDEAMLAMARNARTTGVEFKDAVDEVNRASAYMSKQFGVSAKAIGKNFSEMQADIGTFGDYTRAEMVGVATALAKVGMEMKDLQNIVGKTDDFEGAAEAVAGLSEAFGMQLDTMELMTADPAKKAEMIRDAFHDAGQSFEDMSRQEKKRLADLTGMDVGSLEGFMDPANAGMAFDDFTDAAQDGADGAITQAEANKLLTKSIEKLNETMGGMSSKGGFFGVFMEGVKKGIARSPEFISLMRDIRKSMRIVFQAGKKVGRMLMELFAPSGPLYPVMKIFKEYFSPAAWFKRMEGVKKAFRNFVDMMKKDPQEALAGLLGDLKEVFLDGGGGKFAQIIKEGLTKGIDVIGAMILGAIPKLLGWIRDGLMFVLSMLKGEKQFSTTFFDDVAFPMIIDAWKDLVKQAGPILKEMWEALKEVFTMFWDKYGEQITQFFTGILTALIVASLMKAAAAAAVGAAVGWAVEKLMNTISGASEKLSPGGGGGGDGAEEKSITEHLSDIVDDLATMNPKDVAMAGVNALILVAFVAVGLYGLTLAFAEAAKVVKKLSIEDVLKTALVWLTISLSLAAVAFVLSQTSGHDTNDILKEMAGMVLVVAALALVSIAMAYAIAASPVLEPMQIVSWGAMMVVGIIAAGLAAAAAGLVAKMGIPWMDVIKGLLVLGVVMVILGGIGFILANILKRAATPDELIAVGIFMTAMAVMFAVIALAIPAAAVLGMMLTASPFGPIGVALIILGFAALGLLAIGMINSLIPTIKSLVEIANTIPNVEKFKAVVDALTGIMKAAADMMNAVANIAKALNPGPFGSSANKFNSTLKTLKAFVKDLLDNSIGDIIDKFVKIAESTNMSEKGIQAVGAISEAIAAVAAIVAAFSPSDATMQTLAEVEGTFTSGQATDLMDAMTRNTRQLGTSASKLIKQVTTFIKKELIPATKGMDFSNIGPLVNSIAPMLQGIASLMTALSPSGEAWAVAAEAADTAGEDSVETINAISRQVASQARAVTPMIKQVGTQMKEVIGALQPVISTIGRYDPKILEAFGTIVSGIFSGMSSMLDVAGPAIQAAAAASKKRGGKVNNKQFKSTLKSIGDFIGTIGASMATMVEPLKDMITSLVSLAQGIQDPAKMKDQVSALSGLFGVVTTIADLFAADGPLSAVPPVDKNNVPTGEDSPVVAAATAMGKTMDLLFSAGTFNGVSYPDGLLNGVISAFSLIKVENAGGVKAKAELLTTVFEAMSSIAGTIDMLSSMDSFTEDEGGGSGKLTSMFQNMAIIFGKGSATIGQINSIIEGFNSLTAKVPKLSLIENANKFMDCLVPFTSALSGLQAIPENTVTKIQDIESAFIELVDFIKTAGTNPELDAAVQIGRALTGDGKVTVKHENVNITMKVSVSVDADTLAKCLIDDKQYFSGGEVWNAKSG